MACRDNRDWDFRHFGDIRAAVIENIVIGMDGSLLIAEALSERREFEQYTKAEITGSTADSDSAPAL